MLERAGVTRSVGVNEVLDGQLLWQPDEQRVAEANLSAFRRWLAAHGRNFDTYDQLWRWSIEDQSGFWGAVWSYFGVRSSQPYRQVLGARTMPGAEWFCGARLNYAEHALRYEREGSAALVYFTEQLSPLTLSWCELGRLVRKLATHLRASGITRGDRVVAYLPNCPEAVVAMLATASIGAIWASSGPELGAAAAIDRFEQLAPRAAFCIDGYHYGGKPFDRRPELTRILGSLPSLSQVICLRRLCPDNQERLTPHTLWWEEALSGPDVCRDTFQFEQVAFAHPLWILFSSGTTGLPKPIVHSHGGIIIEQLKALSLHMDMRRGDRVLILTSTGWMMWNVLVSALLVGAVPVLFDGNPMYPGPEHIWSVVDSERISFLGTSPSYVGLLQKAGVVLKERFGLAALKTVMLAGSPVTAECMAWVKENVKDEAWVHSGSGGTDLCTGIVGGVVTEPVYAGEIQRRQLGVAAFAVNERGEAVTNEVGELVITAPLPSMPVGFWNDSDDVRYRSSYFDSFAGIWRHGDFFKMNDRGGCWVLGRSDATLNRHGVRIGTAEVYRALAEVTDVEDALIVNIDLPNGGFFMPLFVRIRGGALLDERLQEEIRTKMRNAYSARHVPDKIYQVPMIPYTSTGKRMEVPVRRILMGVPVEKVADRGAMLDGSALEWFVRYASRQTDYKL